MPVVAAIVPYVVAASAVASAATSIYSASAQKTAASKQKEAMEDMMNQPPPPEPPKLPEGDVEGERLKAEEVAKEQTNQYMRSIGRNKTLFTNPLGISGQAQTIKKRLLGE